MKFLYRPVSSRVFEPHLYSGKMSAMKPSGIKSYDSKYPALSKSHLVQGISLSELRHMCDLCIGAVKHENADEGIDAEFQPEIPTGGACTHINADKKVALKNLGEVALKFYNDTKSKNFKLVKVCKVNTVAGRYRGVTFRAEEDGSEESLLFRGVVFGMGRPKPLFCEIKEDDEVTLLPDDDDYASPERACEMEDFLPPICAVEPDGKKSDDSKYPEEMSAVEPNDKKSDDDSKFPEEMSAIEPDDKKSDDDSMYPEEMSAMMYNIKSYYDSKYPENMSAVESSSIKSFNDSKYPAKMSSMEPRDIKSYDDSKYPALSKSHRVEGISLSSLRKMCDLCTERPHYRLNRGAGGFDPRGLLDLPAGGAVTRINAGKRVSHRNLADVALKFYNGTKSKNFKLVKVCKVNRVAGSYNGVTFRAQEDGSEESPLFRGVVFGMRRPKPLFCEIKEDDEVTLLPYDHDYVSSEPGCGIEDIPPSIRKNDSGDGSAADSGVVAGKSKRQKMDQWLTNSPSISEVQS